MKIKQNKVQGLQKLPSIGLNISIKFLNLNL